MDDYDDDEIESWARLTLGLIAGIFFFIGLIAVVVASCMAWGYFSYEPQCGTVAAHLTQECKK
jgi:hypothetical protein